MKLLSPLELKILMDEKKAYLIDVREPAEVRAEAIEGSLSKPLSSFKPEEIDNQNKVLVVHCKSGRRSQEACQQLKKIYPEKEIFSLEGGLDHWKQLGLPIKAQKDSCKILPLERQAQIGAGILNVIGILLGFIVDRSFFALSGFIGCGLIFAGLSGWCGLAKILAKMPWNQ